LNERKGYRFNIGNSFKVHSHCVWIEFDDGLTTCEVSRLSRDTVIISRVSLVDNWGFIFPLLRSLMIVQICKIVQYFFNFFSALKIRASRHHNETMSTTAKPLPSELSKPALQIIESNPMAALTWTLILNT
jgi:hypothetical protein